MKADSKKEEMPKEASQTNNNENNNYNNLTIIITLQNQSASQIYSKSIIGNTTSVGHYNRLYKCVWRSGFVYLHIWLLKDELNSPEAAETPLPS